MDRFCKIAGENLPKLVNVFSAMFSAMFVLIIWYYTHTHKSYHIMISQTKSLSWLKKFFHCVMANYLATISCLFLLRIAQKLGEIMRGMN